MRDWTECRKKRPMQEECPVICTIEDTNSGKREVQGECFYKAETGWYIKRDFKRYPIEPPYQVIAWMPTPQPYVADAILKELSALNHAK